MWVAAVFCKPNPVSDREVLQAGVFLNPNPFVRQGMASELGTATDVFLLRHATLPGIGS